MIVNTLATDAGPQTIGNGARVVVQNLGPGVIFLSRSADVDPAGPGIKVDVDVAYEFPGATSATYFVTSDTDGTDVRVEYV